MSDKVNFLYSTTDRRVTNPESIKELTKKKIKFSAENLIFSGYLHQ